VRLRSTRLARHPIVRNVAALYGVQVATFVLPLVTLPYLAHTLGPRGLGPVVAAQAFAMGVSTLIEYGFNLSATREAARRRDDGSALAELAAAVLGAKLLLAAGTVVLVGLAFAVPVLRSNPDLLLLGWIAGFAQGFYPLWFFQGLERLTIPAALEFSGRTLAAVLIIALVRDTGDGWLVLALQALAGIGGTSIAMVLMYRMIELTRPRLGSAAALLRESRHLFVYNGALSLYSTANVLLLGLFASGAQVAFFGAAEKLIRAAGRLTAPVSQAVFPRMSFLVGRDEADRARRLASLTLGVLLGLSLLGAALLALLAPLLVSVLFGSDFSESTPVLRVLALTLPLVAISNVLGHQWMLPFGMDRSLTGVILVAGVLNVILAAILAPPFAATGMAVSVVITELAVVTALAIIIRRSERARPS